MCCAQQYNVIIVVVHFLATTRSGFGGVSNRWGVGPCRSERKVTLFRAEVKSLLCQCNLPFKKYFEKKTVKIYTPAEAFY